MLVVSDNLRGIVVTLGICDPHLIEEYSVGIKLSDQIRRMRRKPLGSGQIIYGMPYKSEEFFHPLETLPRDLVLEPGDRVLACSAERYSMPAGYFGLVQTKGSLARLFVSATCNDGQIEPGYDAKITLEVSNESNFVVAIPTGAPIAQMFVFRCTTSAKPYNGRYQGATVPTLADFSSSAPAAKP